MADIMKLFNELRDSEFGYQIREHYADLKTQESSPEAVTPATADINSIIGTETTQPNTVKEQADPVKATENTLNIDPSTSDASIEPTQSAVDAVLNVTNQGDGMINLAQAEADFIETIYNAFDEEGELSMEALPTHVVTEDSHAFDALATSPEAQRYRRYLEEQAHGSVRTGAAGENKNEEAIQRQYVNQVLADKMADNLSLIADLDNQIADLNIQIDDLELEINNLEGVLAHILLQKTEAETKLADLREELDDTEVEHQENKAALDAAEDNAEKTQRELDEAAGVLDEAKESGSPIEQQRAEQDYLRRIDLHADALERLNGAKQNIMDSGAQIESLNEQIAKEVQNIIDLENQADATQQDILDAKGRLIDLQTKVVELQEQKELAVQREIEFQQEDPATYNEVFSTWLQTQVTEGEPWASNLQQQLLADSDVEAPVYKEATFMQGFLSKTSSALSSAQKYLAELQDDLEAAKAEYNQAIEDSAYDRIGSEGLADMAFSDINDAALTTYDENGSQQFKIMANYDENGEMTGIMVSDSRLMLELRATQDAVPLENFSAEDQQIILDAIADAEAASPDGTITLPDGNQFNAALAHSREASAAVARNAQFDAATPGLQINRVQAAEATVEAIQQDIAEASNTTISASAIDGGGIQSDTELASTFAHADQPREVALDNPDYAPESTPAITDNGTMSPMIGNENPLSSGLTS